MTNLKEVFESDNWIITKEMQGSGITRIDAKTRFYKPDGVNFFSKWGSTKYINQLARDNYGKNISEFTSINHH